MSADTCPLTTDGFPRDAVATGAADVGSVARRISTEQDVTFVE